MVSWRICHMIPGFFPIAKGGAEVFTLNFCKNLLKQGHRVIIVTRNLKLPSEEKIQGIHVKRFTNILPYKIKYYGFGRFLRSKYIRMLVAGFDLIAVVPVLWNLHKKNKFHLVHASFIFPFGLAGLIFKKIFKLPLVITVHGPADFYEVPRFFNPVLRFVLKRANAVAVVGKQLKKDLLKRLGYLPIKVVLNGIPIKPFELTERELQLENYNIFPNDFVILTAGRLVRRKNLDLLIRSIPKIQKRIAHSKFIILGSGIEKKNLEEIIKDLRLKSVVVLPGWVSEEEKRRIFKRADIFLQLSYFEGLSLALLESKAAGLPAVVLKASGSLTAVSHGETGIFIHPPLTTEKIVDCIEQLYKNVDLRRVLGENAKNEAKKKYSLERMTKEYIQIYGEVLKYK